MKAWGDSEKNNDYVLITVWCDIMSSRQKVNNQMETNGNNVTWGLQQKRNWRQKISNNGV